MKKNWCILGLSLLMLTVAAEDFILIANGTPAAEMMVEKQVSSADLTFFNESLKRCTGTTLPIVTKRSNGKNAVIFRVTKQTIDREDAFTISFPSNKEMVISGSPESVRWAMNHLLETIGVRFVMAGPHGTYYPQMKTVKIPLQSVKKGAAFKFRRKMWADDPVWERALNGKRELKGEEFEMHNLYNIFPPDKYAAGEWNDKIMPEHKGKRIGKPANIDRLWQPCFSNPAAVTEAVKNIREKLNKHPEFRYFSLGVNDCGGFCECAACAKINGGAKKRSRFGHYYNFSKIYFHWANQVVREVRKTHPDVYFGLLAYRELIDPPPFKIDDHIVPVLTMEIYQYSSPKIRKQYDLLLTEWSKCAKRIGFWEYGYGSRTYAAPRVYTKLQSEALKKYASFGGANFFAEGDSFIGEGPKRYVYYKLLFDPNQNLNKLLDEWYAAAVGKEAAPYLRKYYDDWEVYWMGPEVRKTPWYKSVGSVYMTFDYKSHLYGIKLADMQSARKSMEKMIAAARKFGDADQKIRAERLYQFFELNEARQYACGAGWYPAKDRFDTDTEAAAFLSHVPVMSKYYQKIKPIADAVLKYKHQESFGISWNNFPNEMTHIPFTEQVNAIIPHLKSLQVQEELRKITQNPAVDPVYQILCAALLKSVTVPNMLTPFLTSSKAVDCWKTSINTKVEKAPSLDGTPRFRLISTGGWCAPRITTPMRPDRLYLFTARITPAPNTALSNTRVFMYGAYRYSDRANQQVPSITFPLKKVPVNIYSLIRSGKKSYCGQVYTILNGIRTGGSVYIDNIEVKMLSPEDQLSLMTPAAPIGQFMVVPKTKAANSAELIVPAKKFADSRMLFNVNPSIDKLRVTVSAKGEGRFQVMLLIYPQQRPRSLGSRRSDMMTAVKDWRIQEYETDLKVRNYQQGTRMLVRIQNLDDKEIILKDLKIERIMSKSQK